MHGQAFLPPDRPSLTRPLPHSPRHPPHPPQSTPSPLPLLRLRPLPPAPPAAPPPPPWPTLPPLPAAWDRAPTLLPLPLPMRPPAVSARGLWAQPAVLLLPNCSRLQSPTSYRLCSTLHPHPPLQTAPPPPRPRPRPSARATCRPRWWRWPLPRPSPCPLSTWRTAPRPGPWWVGCGAGKGARGATLLLCSGLPACTLSLCPDCLPSPARASCPRHRRPWQTPSACSLRTRAPPSPWPSREPPLRRPAAAAESSALPLSLPSTGATCAHPCPPPCPCLQRRPGVRQGHVRAHVQGVCVCRRHRPGPGRRRGRVRLQQPRHRAGAGGLARWGCWSDVPRLRGSPWAALGGPALGQRLDGASTRRVPWAPAPQALAELGPGLAHDFLEALAVVRGCRALVWAART